MKNWIIKLLGGFTKEEYEKMAMIALDKDFRDIPDVSVIRTATNEVTGIFK